MKKQIIQKLRKEGLSLNDICIKTGWKKSTVYYHLGKNQREKHLLRQEGRRQMFKDFINSLKLKCSKCDESNPVCLDFHHINNNEKLFSIASAKSKNKILVLEEIKKCIILCSNCHRKLHFGNLTER